MFDVHLQACPGIANPVRREDLDLDYALCIVLNVTNVTPAFATTGKAIRWPCPSGRAKQRTNDNFGSDGRPEEWLAGRQAYIVDSLEEVPAKACHEVVLTLGFV